MGQGQIHRCCKKTMHLPTEVVPVTQAHHVFEDTKPRLRDIIIICGPPGVGSSTHGANIAAALAVPLLSMGELLRRAISTGTALGRKVKEIVEGGEVPSDTVCVDLVSERVQEADCAPGFVLDDFPATLAQAELLTSMLDRKGQWVKLVVALEAPEPVLISRIDGRWIHMPSGRIYHGKSKRPKSLPRFQEPSSTNMFDDLTGEALTKRDEGKSGLMQTRLQAYYTQSAPILDFFTSQGCVRRIDAKRDLGSVWKSIREVMSGRKIFVVLGPPGSGKSTHAQHIGDKLGTPQFCIGDLLKVSVASGTENGQKANAAVHRGLQISDEILLSIVKDRTQQIDCAPGFLLDDFPRTLHQAKMLDKMLAKCGEKVTMVLALEAPDASLNARINGRWVHKASGRIYHVTHKMPLSLPVGEKPWAGNMLDDQTGETLMQRVDDISGVFAKRLKTYHLQAIEVLQHYEHAQSIRRVNASQGIVAVRQRINSIISGRTIVFVYGPPGSGKDVQISRLTNAIGGPRINISGIIKQAVAAGTDFGRRAKALLDNHVDMPDDIVMGVVQERIQQVDCLSGFVFEDFPWTAEQAKKMDLLLAAGDEKVKVLLHLKPPDTHALNGIIGRWVHLPSGRTYHVSNRMPKSLPHGEAPSMKNMLDDVTGEPLVPLTQDAPDEVNKRLATYCSEITPVFKHYEPTGRVVTVDASRDMDSIWYSTWAIITERRLAVILLGPPCSGKRTVAPRIARKLGVPAISIRDLMPPDPNMRNGFANWDDHGQGTALASDDDIIEALRERIEQPDCAVGFLLIQFPRTREQATRLDTLLATRKEKVRLVLELAASGSILVERACGRWVHASSGRSYHVSHKKPKSLIAGEKVLEGNMRDDETGEALHRLEHDTADGFLLRFQGYTEAMRPVLQHYIAAECVQTVAANLSIESVWESIEEFLGGPQLLPCTRDVAGPVRAV